MDVSALIGAFCVIVSYLSPDFMVSKFFVVVAVFFLAKAIRSIVLLLKHRQYEL
ncbi:putative membrane protein [Aliivibrio salmonicida LFI1238]|uniref:Membrane protein n=1 Tax=Aliivibrio salmonicida (strain LFI1238) TaxID=316275 RepID=B6ERF4_ALISL|nr:putative membrane protein [Aliivibrio salmonicida LFI1238]